jgi:transcriptional regulator with XRE-family HTH domain
MQDFNELKHIRKSKGMTQQAVADAAGISLRQYQRFDGGERVLRNASFRVGMAISKALDIRPEELFGHDEN